MQNNSSSVCQNTSGRTFTERLASFGIKRAQFRAPLKPLNTIECCDVQGVSGAFNLTSMILRDASLSDSYAANYRCFPPWDRQFTHNVTRRISGIDYLHMEKNRILNFVD